MNILRQVDILRSAHSASDLQIIIKVYVLTTKIGQQHVLIINFYQHIIISFIIPKDINPKVTGSQFK